MYSMLLEGENMRASVRAISLKGAFAVVILIVATSLALYRAEALREGVIGGMRVAVGVIVPSVLPFMILSDLMGAMLSRVGGVGRAGARIFRIDGRLSLPILLGVLGGFPIGARMTAELYSASDLTREDAERAVIISSSPSLGFTVAGVGVGIWGSATVGIALYLSVLLSSFVYGILTRGQATARGCGEARSLGFSLSRSIDSAVSSSLGIIGSVAFFSALLSLAEAILPPAFATAISPFIEVGGAVSRLGGGDIPLRLALPMSAFALGFSGFAVHIQIRSATRGSDIRYSRFFTAKLLIGLLAAAMLSLLSPFLLR